MREESPEEGLEEAGVRIGSAGVARALVGAGAGAGAGASPDLRAARAPQGRPRPAFAVHAPPPAARPAEQRTPPERGVAGPADGASFREHVAAVASRVRMRAEDLMAILRFESGLRPDAINPTSHAVGLLQFLPGNAADLLGLPALAPDRGRRAIEAFAAMTADEQLPYVEAYLERVLGGRAVTGLRDAYMAVLYPAALGRGAGYVLGSVDGDAFARAVYRQNAALDVNGDGRVTAGEAASRIRG